MTTVPGAGHKPNQVLLVGEAPGIEEAQRGRPFVGKAGREQETYLARHGLSARVWYVTNVIKAYTPGNPDPTPAQIKEWSPVLQQELNEVDPLLVVAVGRFAARWFLGGVDLETVHGIPHRSEKAPGAVVVPIYHPAAGLYDTNLRGVIAWDYGRVAEILERIERGAEVEFREDEWAGRERYSDVSGAHLAADSPPWGSTRPAIGIDTEGTPGNPWSIQISLDPGTGLVLRTERDDFDRGIKALQDLADAGTIVVMHNAMFDIEMCRVMGLDLSNAWIWDTMYGLYLLRVEPQGLKAAAYRWTGMQMASYRETVGDAGRERQVDYLGEVLGIDWPKPEPRAIVENDGTSRLYQPQAVGQRVEKILVDLYSGKQDKDGNPVDVLARWKMVDPELRATVEGELGPMPVGSLADIPLADAVWYSARDADAALRLYHRLSPELERQGLGQLMKDGMGVLPVFEEIQATGMTASRSRFEALEADVQAEMHRLQSRISHRYYGDRPFNPGSPKAVAALMRRRGLVGEKQTTTGQVSTAKKSIEHLRNQDPAIADVIDWREHAKIRDTFCRPALERMLVGGDVDIHPIRCQIKTTRVTTRRLAAANPNLLQIPTRHALGRRVRDCYVAPPGQLYGAWDLAQIEARVMAHESGDPLLCRLFQEGRDIHAELASTIFDTPLDQVHPIDQRYPAKRGLFGIFYGISAAGLFDQLRMMGCRGWSADRCQELIDETLKVYEGMDAYINQTVREVEREGMVRDHWGMIRYLPGAWSRDRKTRSEAGRMAVSHKIQGGAQGMIQQSMIWLRPWVRELQEEGGEVHWSLQVHDELILRFDEGLWETVDSLVMEGLTQHHGWELKVPVEAEGARAETWGGLK